MAIYRKETVAKYLDELEAHYKALRAAAKGLPPSENLAHGFNREPDAFLAEFTDVDLEKLNWELDHFALAAKHLKNLAKRKPEKRNGY